MSKRRGKIQSINFEDETYKILTDEVNKIGGNYSSTLNRLIRHALAIDNSVKEEMAMHAYQKALELKKEASEESGFGKAALQKQSEQYMDLVSLFTSGEGITVPALENMQRIDMKCDYLICPDTWIQLSGCEPEEATSAIVIECRHSKDFNLPHFVFLTDRPITRAMKSNMLAEAVEASEEMKQASTRWTDPCFSKDGSLLNEQEYNEQPIPGFFEIPRFGTTDTYPYGAMVIKKRSEKK